VSNHIGSLTWAAACPRTTVPSSRALALLSAVGHTSPDYGHVRLSGGEKRVEHVFAKFAAAQLNAQVKDTGVRMSLGPPPWRPPE
jgi:hypothetical protein